MEPQELRHELSRKFCRATWTGDFSAPGLLRKIFPPERVDIFHRPNLIVSDPEVARKVEQLGVVTLADGKKLGVFDVELASAATQIARNRVGLRNLTRSLITPGTINGVLAFYHHDDVAEYRFSFISRQSRIGPDGILTAEETHPKRFTYVFGEGQTCSTAAQRFVSLVGKPAGIADLINAFSVEKLSDEFFTEYKDTHYARFCEHLSSLTDIQRKNAFGDDKDAAKRLRNFVKKLLGRLVFLHFLQKKGWLGAPAVRTDWAGGDPRFFQNLLKNYPQPEKFYSGCLTKLFFETLNVRRARDLFEIAGCAPARVPYLNGGLFDDDPAPTMKLNFPPALFQDLFDFFERYNFTIDENSPDDHEVGIDPEMLGRIFENLLEDNKEKGAYYTRREVVHYMCQHSLYRYLRGQLLADTLPETAMEARALNQLVYTYDIGHLHSTVPEHIYINKNATAIVAALDRIKICDPAIGSGAFPIGLLQVIFLIKWTLVRSLNHAQAKRAIIQNSIYGVDLDSGAVDIARLRFWLSLVVDEETPVPLPNLDYKIMQGNALLEWFEGIPLDNLTGAKPRAVMPGQLALFAAPGETPDLNTVANDGEFAEFSGLLREYFSTEGKEKKAALHAKIDKRVLQAIDDRITYVQELLETERHQHIEVSRELRRNFARRHGDSPRKESEIDDFLSKDSRFTKAQRRIAELTEQIHENEKRRVSLCELQKQDNAERPFFLWHFFFQDVFAQGGFDIVIANPPYVRADHPAQKEQREAIGKTGKYETLWEKWDLFVAFIEQSFRLLKPGGVMAQIVSDGYCHAKYAQKSQNWFLENARIVRLDFVSELKLFDALVRNIIFFIEKANGTRWRPERRRHNERSGRLPEEPMIGDVTLLPTDEQAKLTHRVFFPENAVAKTYSATTLMLEEICYISKGMVVHADEREAKGQFKLEHLVSDVRDKKHPKRFAEGKHLGRWSPRMHKWLEWDTERAPALFSRPTFTELYDVPEKLISVDMSAGVEQLKVVYDDEQLFHNHSAWSFVPWHLLEGVKNNSLKKAARYPDEKPKREDLPNRLLLEKQSRRFPTKFLAAVMNSSFAYDFLKANRRSNIHLFPDDWKKLPIPDVSEEQQAPVVALVDKILAAKRAKPDADVSELEAEADRLVTELYGIGSGKGAPPVRVERATADTKTLLRDHVLAELTRRAPYVSIESIRKELAARRIAIADSTLLNYMQEFVAAGFIHDAGRGWYSTLAQRLTLDRAPVEPVVALIKDAFPELDFSVWSTQQINPWMHHQLGKFVTFVHVEKDGLAAVWELLRDAGYDAYRNPGKREIEKTFAVREKTVVIRPGNTAQSPVEDSHYAAPEKILVDLADEIVKIPLADTADFDALFRSAIQSGRLDIPILLRYSERKRLDYNMLNTLDSILSQNGET